MGSKTSTSDNSIRDAPKILIHEKVAREQEDKKIEIMKQQEEDKVASYNLKVAQIQMDAYDQPGNFVDRAKWTVKEMRKLNEEMGISSKLVANSLLVLDKGDYLTYKSDSKEESAKKYPNLGGRHWTNYANIDLNRIISEKFDDALRARFFASIDKGELINVTGLPQHYVKINEFKFVIDALDISLIIEH